MMLAANGPPATKRGLVQEPHILLQVVPSWPKTCFSLMKVFMSAVQSFRGRLAPSNRIVFASVFEPAASIPRHFDQTIV